MIRRNRCVRALRGTVAVLGCSYLAAVVVFIMTSGWPAIVASALLFAHPFSLWEALHRAAARGASVLCVAAMVLANLILVAYFGEAGMERVSPWQAFVWTELAVCAFPLALDYLASQGRSRLTVRHAADWATGAGNVPSDGERIPSAA